MAPLHRPAGGGDHDYEPREPRVAGTGQLFVILLVVAFVLGCFVYRPPHLEVLETPDCHLIDAYHCAESQSR